MVTVKGLGFRVFHLEVKSKYHPIVRGSIESLYRVQGSSTSIEATICSNYRHVRGYTDRVQGTILAGSLVNPQP